MGQGWKFADFELNLERGCLQQHGNELPLRPKSFAMLLHLVEHAGELVTRDDLMAAVWPGVIVSDDSITQCLTELRRVLGDDERSIIRTVPRRGLILDVPVHPLSPSPRSEARHAPPAKRGLWVIALLVALAALLWWFRSDQFGESPQSVTAENSVAVLPFADMSPASDHQYFADGISEEILNQLAQSPDLVVIARTSSFAFRGLNEDVRVIGDKLDVAFLLEGSVRTQGDDIRVTAQLVNTKDGLHLWSRTYEGTLDDIFSVQTNIAEDVAGSLHVRLAEYGAFRDTDPQAYSLFLEGRFFYLRRGNGDIVRARERFENAVSIDPQFAEAWASLAASINARFYDRREPALSAQERARLVELQGRAIEQALEFGPHLAMVQHRAAQFYFYNGEKERARRHLEAAREIDPNHWLVRSAIANELRKLGRLNESIALTRQDVREDPMNIVQHSNLITQLIQAREPDSAQYELDRLVEMESGSDQKSVLPLELKARLQIAKGNYQAALETARELPDSLRRAYLLALAETGLGHSSNFGEEKERLASDAESLWKLIYAAEIQVYSGEVEAAISSLQQIEFLPDCRNEMESMAIYYSPILSAMNDNPAWLQIRSRVRDAMEECLIGLDV